MEMERLSKRRRRNTYYSTEEKRPGEKCNGLTERMRLERKKAMYDKQEIALRKMQNVVTDQMMKVEVEGLQLAANIREKEVKEFSLPFDDANECESVDHERVNFDDVEEVNKNKLDLDTCLEEMLCNNYCPVTEEEEDDENEMNFQYLQEFKAEDESHL